MAPFSIKVRKFLMEHNAGELQTLKPLFLDEGLSPVEAFEELASQKFRALPVKYVSIPPLPPSNTPPPASPSRHPAEIIRSLGMTDCAYWPVKALCSLDHFTLTRRAPQERRHGIFLQDHGDDGSARCRPPRSRPAQGGCPCISILFSHATDPSTASQPGMMSPHTAPASSLHALCVPRTANAHFPPDIAS